MAREALQTGSQLQQLLPARGVEIIPQRGAQALGLRQGSRGVIVQPGAGALQQSLVESQRKADIAQRRARAECDHGAGHGHMLRTIFVIDILDDLLAAVGGEIDVDVGRGGALGRKEAFEDQAGGQWVDGGDAEQVSHQRVSGAAAPLAEDATPAGEAHYIPYQQKVVRQALLGN